MSRTNKPSFMDGLNYAARRASLYWTRNSGKILTIAGTTGLLFTGVHSCRRTYKIHDKLTENGNRIREANIPRDDDGKFTRFFRTAKETALVSMKTAKDYLPDIVAGSLSGFAVSKGWQSEHSLYTKAAGMAGILAADFLNYRLNVIDDLGKDADRKYLTTKREHRKVLAATMEDGTKPESGNNHPASDGEGITVSMDPRHLRILYSEHTTPKVWSTMHQLRLNHLEQIVNRLTSDLIYGGFYTVNDFRREFYGKRGDIPSGGLYGRAWDPGNPEHPERGRAVNIHYQEDDDFMQGRKDWCWIYIDIDDEPLIETVFAKNEMNFTPVEDIVP